MIMQDIEVDATARLLLQFKFGLVLTSLPISLIGHSADNLPTIAAFFVFCCIFSGALSHSKRMSLPPTTCIFKQLKKITKIVWAGSYYTL